MKKTTELSEFKIFENQRNLMWHSKSHIMTIQDLHKNDKFRFNDTAFVVIRKWISDEKPLIAQVDSHIYERQVFYYEGLEIEKV